MAAQGHSAGGEFEPGLDRRPFVETGFAKQPDVPASRVESRSWKQGFLSKSKQNLCPNRNNMPLFIVIALTTLGILLFLGIAILFFGVTNAEKQSAYETPNAKHSNGTSESTPLNLRSSTTTTMKAPLPVEIIDAVRSSRILETMKTTETTTEIPTTTELPTTTEASTPPTSTVTFLPSTTTARKTTTATEKTTTTPEVETTQDEVHPMEYFGNNLDKNTAEDCLQHYANGGSSDIYPITRNGTNMKVFCEMEAENGGWTVIHRRVDDKYDFERRGWKDYVTGFGDLKNSFWLGLENIHQLAPTSGEYVTLRIELIGSFCTKTTCSNSSNTEWFGEWDFKLGGQETDYTLDISRSTKGNLTSQMFDVFYEMSNGQKFSTIDRDNDQNSVMSCALFRMFGPWWHSNCTSVALHGKRIPPVKLPRYYMWNHEETKHDGLLGLSYVIRPYQSTMMIRPKF